MFSLGLQLPTKKGQQFVSEVQHKAAGHTKLVSLCSILQLFTHFAIRSDEQISREAAGSTTV